MKSKIFLMVAHFYGQMYAAEGMGLGGGEGFGVQKKIGGDPRFILLCDFEKAQSDHERLLARKKDLDITDRLEKAAELLGALDNGSLAKDSELEEQIVLAGKQVDVLRVQVDLYRAECQKAEDARREQLANDKEKNLGKSVRPWVAFWQKKYGSPFV